MNPESTIGTFNIEIEALSCQEQDKSFQDRSLGSFSKYSRNDEISWVNENQLIIVLLEKKTDVFNAGKVITDPAIVTQIGSIYKKLDMLQNLYYLMKRNIASSSSTNFVQENDIAILNLHMVSTK
ncbi:hypothetical protein JTB14_035617 [Gonioctena quinquepunctata]|nr:hypothetical protein JTB14_035617 [Gonioctena quinquepunctata]